MYIWLWRHLPGPTLVRATICVVLMAAIVVVLFQWGFAYLAPLVPFNNGTVSR